MNPILENYYSLVSKYQVLEKQTRSEDIHQKRVILRRIFPILSIYNIQPRKMKNAEKVFKLFGKLRDVQVQLEKLATLTLTNQLAEYEFFLQIKQIELQLQISNVTHKKKIKFPKPDKSQEVDPTKLRMKTDAQLTKLIKHTATPIANDTHNHTLRIKLKKYRYQLETLAMVVQIDSKKLEKLKHYQDLMGEIHDYEILINGIKKYFRRRISKEVNIKRLEEKQRKLIKTLNLQAQQIVQDCREVLTMETV